MSQRILMVHTSHDRLGEVVPHLVEDALKAAGADYSKADDFAPYT